MYLPREILNIILRFKTEIERQYMRNKIEDLEETELENDSIVEDYSTKINYKNREISELKWRITSIKQHLAELYDERGEYKSKRDCASSKRQMIEHHIAGKVVELVHEYTNMDSSDLLSVYCRCSMHREYCEPVESDSSESDSE